MGTTAEKLTYLNTTKGKIKDSINLTGANIGSNDTFRSYAVKLRDSLVNVLNNGTIVLYNNFPKVSGTGSNISLSNTLEAPMFMNKFDGDTLQNGTPTPSNPIEIQSVEKIQAITIGDGTDSDTYEVNLEGKNLFDGVVAQGEFYSSGNINTSTTTRNYSVNYIPVKPSTQYVSNYNLNRVCFYDENKTFISRSSSYNFKTFTTLSNAYYIRFDISTDYDTNTLQLEKGSTSTSYVPYRLPIKLYNEDYITGTPDNWSIVRNNGVIDSYNGETITTDYISTTGGLDTGATIVYKLSTSTTTPITDTYLISQLNALYNAKSYDGQTNISVSGQLPMILEVSAIKDEI